MRTFHSEEISHDFAVGRVFRIDGWRCDPDHSTFDKVFRLPGGRRFRLNGVFVQSTGGKCGAEVRRLVRLLSRAEASLTQNDNQDVNEMVQVIPTPVEAKAALVRWLQELDHTGGAQFLYGFPNNLSYLQSNECREALANAGIIEAENCYTIDDWTIVLDDLSFTMLDPVEPQYREKDLVGHFELTPEGKWKTVVDRYWFSVH